MKSLKGKRKNNNQPSLGNTNEKLKGNTNEKPLMLAGSVRARGDPLRQPDREWWVWIPGAKREPSTTVYSFRVKTSPRW